MNKKRRLLLLKGLVWLFGLAPLVWLIWRGLTDRLGANPIEEFLHHLGDTALIYLLITLSITPVRRLTGWNILAPLRRPIGLFAFFYLTMHFLWYAVLDQTLDFEFIIEDVVERPYILAGFTAWLLLIPLAITSTKGWIRRLKKNWLRLHRLVYVSTGLGVLHFYWQVKLDTYWPVVAAIVLAVLFLLRIRWRRRRGRSTTSLPHRSAPVGRSWARSRARGNEDEANERLPHIERTLAVSNMLGQRRTQKAR